jgi:phage virion morphogenesis protein
MIDISIDSEATLRRLQGVAARLADTRPLTRMLAGIMHRAVEDNFEQQGRPRWPNLAAATIAGRTKQGTWPGKILQRTGSLAASITQESGAGFARVGTNKVYAAIQQFGGTTRAHVIRPRSKRALAFGGIVVREVHHPGSRIPARPFLALTADDERDLISAAEQFVIRPFG